MSEMDMVRLFFCAAIAGVVLLQFYVFNKGKRRYLPIIDPSMLLIFFGMFIPAMLMVFEWDMVLSELSCTLFAVVALAIVYYMALLALLPLLRRWFSPEAVATLWLLPNFLYLMVNPALYTPGPRLMWLVKPLLLRRVAVIWGTGAAAVLLYSIIQHLRFRQQMLKNAVPVTDSAVLEQWERLQEEIIYKKKWSLPLLTSPNVVTPLSIGLTRYTIQVVLPQKAYTPEELELIFRHELIHIAHGDAMLKLTLTCCAALGWFNPLLWLAMKRCAQDTELSCDRQVMEDCGQAQGQQYAALILSSAGDERGFTTCLSADAKALRYRLKGIVSPRKRLRGGVLVTLVLFLLLYSCNSFGLAWEAGTARELIFDRQPQASTLFSVAWDDRKNNAPMYEFYNCTDEAAFTEYLADLKLYQTGNMYDFSGEDGLIIIYHRPDGLTFGFALRERSVTATYFDKDHKSRQVRYYLEQPTDWERLHQWLEPQQLMEEAA